MLASGSLSGDREHTLQGGERRQGRTESRNSLKHDSIANRPTAWPGVFKGRPTAAHRCGLTAARDAPCIASRRVWPPKSKGVKLQAAKSYRGLVILAQSFAQSLCLS